MLLCNNFRLSNTQKKKTSARGRSRLVLRIKIRVTCLSPFIATERLRGSRPQELPRVPPPIRLPFGAQQLSVRDDNVWRRFGRLDAVRPPLVLVLLPDLRRHLDFGLSSELAVLLVTEGAEGGGRGVGVHAVVGAAIARAVALGGEEALPRLASAVAHLRWIIVVHLQEQRILLQVGMRYLHLLKTEA